MALPFLHRMIVHAVLPLLMVAALVLAFVAAGCTITRGPAGRERAGARRKLQRFAVIRTSVFLFSLLYPGLARTLFTTLRCTDIPEVGLILSRDLSVACFERAHWDFVALAICFMVLYILGVPLLLFAVLWSHREYLHDSNSGEKYREMWLTLGGLYKQFDSDHWWFELVNLFTKMILTGALTVVLPGSPVQLFLALIVTLIYLLVVLQTKPYTQDSHDLWKFLSTLTMVFTMLGGLVLVMDLEEAHFNSGAIDAVLVAMSCSMLFIHFGFIVFVETGGGRNCMVRGRGSDDDGSGDRSGSRNGKKVAPVASDEALSVRKWAG